MRQDFSHKYTEPCFHDLKQGISTTSHQNKGSLFHTLINTKCCGLFSLFSGGNVGGVFAIDSFGNITVAKELDRETKSTYELTVTAQDRAGASSLYRCRKQRKKLLM